MIKELLASMAVSAVTASAVKDAAPPGSSPTKGDKGDPGEPGPKGDPGDPGSKVKTSMTLFSECSAEVTTVHPRIVAPGGFASADITPTVAVVARSLVVAGV